MGLLQVGERLFDPEIGRWLSPDPIGFAAGLNLYAYCDGDPIGSLDPTGLEGFGHHYVPRSIFERAGLPSHVRNFFNKATTGPIPGGHNYAGHGPYNRAVKQMWVDYLNRYQINPAEMTLAQAERFLYAVRKSRNSIIRGYLNKYVTQRFAAAARQATDAMSESLPSCSAIGRAATGLRTTALRTLAPIFLIWDAMFGMERERQEYNEYWANPRNYEDYMRDPREWHRRNPLSFGPPL